MLCVLVDLAVCSVEVDVALSQVLQSVTVSLEHDGGPGGVLLEAEHIYALDTFIAHKNFTTKMIWLRSRLIETTRSIPRNGS